MPRLVIGMMVALALPASAAAGPKDEVWFGGTTRALRSASADAVTDDNLGGAAFGYGRALIPLGASMALWAEAGATIDDAHGTMFQTLATRLGVLDLTAGLRLRYQLHRLVAASARVDAGVQRTSLDIADASDATWGAMTSAAVALDLLAVAEPRFGLGLRAELGYTRAQARALALHTATGSDALQLPQMAAAIGRLDLSGPTFGVSLLGQF